MGFDSAFIFGVSSDIIWIFGAAGERVRTCCLIERLNETEQNQNKNFSCTEIRSDDIIRPPEGDRELLQMTTENYLWISSSPSESCKELWETHPLSFSAHCVADHVGPVRRARGREDGGLPLDLQDPRGRPAEHLHILGRQGRSWGGTGYIQ